MDRQRFLTSATHDDMFMFTVVDNAVNIKRGEKVAVEALGHVVERWLVLLPYRKKVTCMILEVNYCLFCRAFAGSLEMKLYLTSHSHHGVI